jgi:hypothetical protein
MLIMLFCASHTLVHQSYLQLRIESFLLILTTYLDSSLS